MNRLWVRLSLAFGAIVVIGFGAVSLTAPIYFSDSNLQSLVSAQLTRPAGLRDQLAEFYANNGSWQGVEDLMTGANSTLLLNSNRRLNLILTDPQGEVIYASDPTDSPRRLDPQRLRQAQPITVDGRVVGHLDLFPGGQRPPPRSFPPGPPEDVPPDFVEQVSGFLLQISLIGGVLALVFGVLVSRGLSAPLTHLVDGTKAIARRNLSFRVSERGSTEMKELAHSFNDMAAALEEAETLRQNLLADVAHELRTPLTVLEGNLRAILDDVYPLEKEEIARLYDQTRHLHRLVDDLRLLAQADARQLPLHVVPVDLVSLLGELAELFRPLAGERSLSLDTRLPPGPVQIMADPARISQALQNLLYNAFQHTPAGGKVSVSLARTKEAVTVAVADSGEGIAAADLPYVFERFYRADKARARDTGGVGLGLAIVRALVEAHGGSVTAASPGVGQGTVFYVHLPPLHEE